MSFASQILRHATDTLGFSHAAIAPAHPLEHAYLLDAWLAESRHGLMHYMQNHRLMREDVRVMEAQTQSVVVVTAPYSSGPDLLPGGLRIARYAHHLDYHELLRPKLESLADFVRSLTGAPVFSRACTDSAPLLEREMAADAGLGWIGKNTLLLHPKAGSFFLLAELLLGLPFEQFELPAPTPQPHRCGRCTRCIDVCPTNAIAAPYLLDARRCISYLTIELKGPIPLALRPLIGDHLFGCDLCQDVCPWNSKHPGTTDPDFLPPPSLRDLTPQDLLALDAQAFRDTFASSPLRRSKRRGILRNAAVVLGNAADLASLPALIQALGQEPEALVRGHLAWAIGQFAPHPEALRALTTCLEAETDPFVLDELHLAKARFVLTPPLRPLVTE